jgi:hypothetical protein
VLIRPSKAISQIVEIFEPVARRHPDDAGLVKRREDCGNDRLRNRFRAATALRNLGFDTAKPPYAGA